LTVRQVLIVEDDTLVGMGLRAHLEHLGYKVIAQAAAPEQAMAIYKKDSPDLVLMDVRLDEGDGIELAEQLLKQRRCPMIIVSAYSDAELIKRASEIGIFGYLIKPVSEGALAAQIAVASKRFAEHEALIQEKEALQQNLETRKLVERAKGIYMKRLNLSEGDAHKRLQMESQKRRIGIGELAKKIIESEELLGGEAGAMSH